jgi:hypothetical protein
MPKKPQERKIMTRQPASKRDDPAQSRQFIEKAREIGADEKRSESDALIGQLAKKPPEPRRRGN